VVSTLLNFLRAQGKRLDDLLEMVPLLIFLAIWIFAGIAKSMSKSRKRQQAEQEGKQQPVPTDLRELARLAREHYLAAQKKLSPQQPRKPSGPPPIPSARQAPQVPSRIPPRGPVRTVSASFQAPRLKPARPTPEPSQVVPAPPQPTEPPTPPKTRPFKEQPPSTTKRPAIPTLKYRGPENLRQAIILSEIIGKPLSLRQPRDEMF